MKAFIISGSMHLIITELVQRASCEELHTSERTSSLLRDPVDKKQQAFSHIYEDQSSKLFELTFTLNE